MTPSDFELNSHHKFAKTDAYHFATIAKRRPPVENDIDFKFTLELAEFIMRYGAEPDRDLRELWSRIVSSIAVSNTDDHLRNHGFLLSESGWSLSPAYDITPNPPGYGLSLNISESDNALDFSLPLQVAPSFRLSAREANNILKKTTGIVSLWKTYANAVAPPGSEQETMTPAFHY